MQTDKNCYSYKKKGQCCDEATSNNGSIHPTQSKLAMMRNKLLPRLSSIFFRSNTKRFGHSKENPVNLTKDHCCQVYSVNFHDKHKRRSNNGHDSSIQSISTEDELDQTPVLLPKTDKSLKYSTERCDLLSSELSLDTAKSKMKKIVEKELKKYYLKKQYIKRNKEQQYPSRYNVKVYNAADSNQAKTLQNQLINFGCDVMPSNSSVFWEYLVDRINKKYQNNFRSGVLKSCHCTNSQQCPSMAGLNLRVPQANKEYITQDQYTKVSLPCSCKNSHTSNKPENQSDGTLNKKPSKGRCKCKCRTNNNPLKNHPPGIIHTSETPERTTPQAVTPAPATPRNEEIKRPCQEPHDEVKASLQGKYNGEILCIHNPPCILINGCLNLPPVKGQFGPSAWPVTQETSYHIDSTMRNNAIVERACQYQPPEMQYHECEVQMMVEKTTQSICNHDPPCEVVRCCYKPNFDMKLDNSCIHVPMCPKIPECLLTQSDNVSRVCDHQPKCPELPICKDTMGELVVNHADNVGVQVKPVMEVCQHPRPCILIPKCLGKMMAEGYVSCDAIPDCAHQPTCEMIPACCRKSAKMVSVYCQYPAPCRIV